jgi:hypothetical protein
VGHFWSRKRHGNLQLKASGAVRNRGWSATERPWLAFSYRRWLTVEPSRKPTISTAPGAPKAWTLLGGLDRNL